MQMKVQGKEPLRSSTADLRSDAIANSYLEGQMREHSGSKRRRNAPSTPFKLERTRRLICPGQNTRHHGGPIGTAPHGTTPDGTARLGLTLQSLDDQGRSGGDDRDGRLTVLDGELDGDAETLPVAGGLGDVFSDLLGGLWRRANDVREAGRGEASEVSEVRGEWSGRRGATWTKG
jgi:hypothetical protein